MPGNDPGVTLAFWKPYGVLTKFTDADSRETLADYVDVPEVYPAGRLDRDSEGLLILSSDPRLRGALTASHHARTYVVQVEGVPERDAIEQLQQGVEIQGRTTRPASVRILDSPPALPPRPVPVRVRRHIPDSWLELTVTEGRNRQVRRMTAAVGHPTLRLVRTMVGPIGLEDLSPGSWRELRNTETEALWSKLRAAPRPRRRSRNR